MSTTQTYPITGIPLAPGTRLPVRREINAWYSDASPTGRRQVSLFMHAMISFKDKPITELLSFFQIAGIHSEPLVGWDGEHGTTKGFDGFCNHNKITFPTWHRPYMLLYEQVIHAEMITVIQKWVQEGLLSDQTDLARWELAASQFRLPYWDWARQFSGKFGLPAACCDPSVEVVMPRNSVLLLPNPLVGFQNPVIDPVTKQRVPMGSDIMGPNRIPDTVAEPENLPWSQCVGVSRFAITKDNRNWIDGINNFPFANEAMNDPLWYGNGSGPLSDAVSRMFEPGYLKSWSTFSSTIHNPPKGQENANAAFMSLEYIHNILHNTCGGTNMTPPPPTAPGFKGVGLGHMSDVPVAAFDPIFWFHHCNIDRLTAFWQTLNPTLWFDVILPGDPKPDDPLKPFHTDTNGSLWTSTKARDWTKLNYQYDDLLGSNGQVLSITELRAHIDALYPSTRKIASSVPEYRLADHTFHDYIINVVYDRYALNGRAYSILFFLGPPPDDLATFASNENFVGSVYTFSAPIVTRGSVSLPCDNCVVQQERGVLSKAQVPITVPLLARVLKDSGPITAPGRIWTPLRPGDLNPDAVDAILDKQLQWRYVEIGGREVPANELPATEIAVLHGKGHLLGVDRGAPGGTLPSYGKYKKLHKATLRNGEAPGFLHRAHEIIHDDD